MEGPADQGQAGGLSGSQKSVSIVLAGAPAAIAGPHKGAPPRCLLADATVLSTSFGNPSLFFLLLPLLLHLLLLWVNAQFLDGGAGSGLPSSTVLLASGSPWPCPPHTELCAISLGHRESSVEGNRSGQSQQHV